MTIGPGSQTDRDNASRGIPISTVYRQLDRHLTETASSFDVESSLADLRQRILNLESPPRRVSQGVATAGPSTISNDWQTTALLVERARASDEVAWNEIVELFAPLVWSVCGQFRLSREDSEDVGQSVWLLLVEHIGSLRDDPAALPGWLATTTRRECLRTVRAEGRRGRASLPDDSHLPAGAVEDLIFAAERDAALRAALAELPRRCRELLSMLASDPPLGYAEIGTNLGIAVGSVGHIRARCLEKLRRSPHLAALTEVARQAVISRYTE